MKIINNLALENIKKHKVRSFLTILGIAFGVGVIIAVFALNASFEKSTQKLIKEMGTGNTDIWIEKSSEETESVGTNIEGFSDQVIVKIKENNNIDSVFPSIKMYTTASHLKSISDLFLYGVDFNSDTIVRNYFFTAGKMPENKMEIIVGEVIAELLDLQLDSEITLQTPNGKLPCKISGILNQKQGVGILNNNKIGFIDISLLQQYFNFPDKVTSLNVVLKKGADLSFVQKWIKSNIPVNLNVFTNPLMILSEQNSMDRIRFAVIFFGFIAIFVAVLIVYITIISYAEQNKKEIGFMRLLGMTKKQIVEMVIKQSFLYSLLGGVVGIAIGYGFYWILIQIISVIFKYQSFSFEFPSPGLLGFAIVFGMIITIVTTFFSIKEFTVISPVDFFKNNQNNKIRKDNKITINNIIGMVFVIIAVILGSIKIQSKVFSYIKFSAPIFMFIGLGNMLDLILFFILKLLKAFFSRICGISGLLAIEDLMLRIKNTAVTVNAIIIGLSLAIGFLGMVNSMKYTARDWLDKTKWADLIVFSISGAEIKESIIEQLKNYSFTKDLNPIRYYFVPYSHEDLSDNGFIFQGVDPVKFSEFVNLEVLEGNTQEAVKNMEEGTGILINKNLANMLKLRQGDYIDIQTAGNPVQLRIEGTIVDNSDFVHRLGKMVYGSFDLLKKYWKVDGYTVLHIKLADGIIQDDAKRIILNDLSINYNIKILTHGEEKEEVGLSLNRIFSIFYSINLVVFVIIFVVLFNTILINIIAQLIQFAILRAMGLSKRQLKILIILEGIVMGLLGVLFAVIIGSWITSQFILGAEAMMGISFNFYFPFGPFIFTGLLTIVFSIFAALYPQHMALQKSISGVLQESNEL